MWPELRATTRCLSPARNVVDEKTARLKIIAQHGGESRLVFDHEDPWLVETRCAATPHKDPPITQMNEVDQANILLWVRSNRTIDQHPVAVEND
jgi:hypothetical protein